MTIYDRIAIVRLIDLLYNIFYYLLLGRILFSFITLGRDANPTLIKVRQFVFRMTEPVLAPLRAVIKPVHIGGGSYLDLSPLIALILLSVLRGLLIRVFFGMF